MTTRRKPTVRLGLGDGQQVRICRLGKHSSGDEVSFDVEALSAPGRRNRGAHERHQLHAQHRLYLVTEPTDTVDACPVRCGC
jgi:P pilus assembly chaperone PapD